LVKDGEDWKIKVKLSRCANCDEHVASLIRNPPEVHSQRESIKTQWRFTIYGPLREHHKVLKENKTCDEGNIADILCFWRLSMGGAPRLTNSWLSQVTITN